MAVTDRHDHRHPLLPRRHPWLLQRALVQQRMGDPGVEQAASQRAGLRVTGHGRGLRPARHVPRPGRTEPQHPDGVAARDHRPAGEPARPRIGPQPESRRNELITWPLACENRRIVGSLRADSLGHLPRVLRPVQPGPPPSVTHRMTQSISGRRRDEGQCHCDWSENQCGGSGLRGGSGTPGGTGSSA